MMQSVRPGDTFYDSVSHTMYVYEPDKNERVMPRFIGWIALSSVIAAVLSFIGPPIIAWAGVNAVLAVWVTIRSRALHAGMKVHIWPAAFVILTTIVTLLLAYMFTTLQHNAITTVEQCHDLPSATQVADCSGVVMRGNEYDPETGLGKFAE